MAEETWSPGLINGLVNYAKKPPSSEWVQTSTKVTHLPYFAKNGGNAVIRMPVYTKKKAADPLLSNKDLARVTPADPLVLGDSNNSAQIGGGQMEADKPVAQDFRLAEQSSTQRNYLDKTLSDRMDKFQSLLNSLVQ